MNDEALTVSDYDKLFDDEEFISQAPDIKIKQSQVQRLTLKSISDRM
jgi:hypothetical protein